MKFSEYKNNREKKRILLVAGSARSPDCCPDEKSKTHMIVEHLKNKFSEKAIFEIIDLSVKCDGVTVQPCKACVSTSAFHCHWPCDCFSKKSEPKDLMYQQDVYKKLDECDAMFVVTPVNWSSCSSVVKSFFDRLVCANLTITSEQADVLMEGDTKSAKKSRALEKDERYRNLLKNHLEGKRAAFFAHGNMGGADYREIAKDGKGPSEPASLKDYEDKHGKEDQSNILDPLVRQCVYSGIHVDDDCVRVVTHGFGLNYSEANDKFNAESKLMKEAEEVMSKLISLIGE